MAVRHEGRHAIVRAQLAQLIHDSRLPIVVFSQWVLGRCERTAPRYLAGEPIPDDTAAWIQHVESIEHNGDVVTIRLRWGRRKPRWNHAEIKARRAAYFRDSAMGGEGEKNGQ